MTPATSDAHGPTRRATIDPSTLRQQVETEVGESWETFAARHPALASVLDVESVSEHVTISLASDPAFRRAYLDAAAAHVAAQRVGEVVRTFASAVLARMG